MTGRALLGILGLVAGGVIATAAPAPVLAQVQDQVIDVYGDDPCPSSNGQEIVVCQRHPRNDQFRIPKALRDSDPPPQALGGGAVSAVNSTGGNAVQVQSCNAVGSGVDAGCFKKQADAWKAQKKAEKAEADSIP